MVRHAFTVDEWHRMGEAGLFVGETRRTELFDGEIIEMAVVGSRHAGLRQPAEPAAGPGRR